VAYLTTSQRIRVLTGWMAWGAKPEELKAFPLHFLPTHPAGR